MTEDAPRYVLSSAGDATGVLRRLARAGWHTRDGFALTEAGWDVRAAKLVLFGRVVDVDTAELALLAAARGAGVVAIADTTTDTGRALLADQMSGQDLTALFTLWLFTPGKPALAGAAAGRAAARATVPAQPKSWTKIQEANRS